MGLWALTGPDSGDPNCYDAACSYLEGQVQKLQCEDNKDLIRFLSHQRDIPHKMGRWLRKQGWDVEVYQDGDPELG